MRPPSSGVRTAAARPPAASFLLATAATAALVGGFYFWLVVSSFRLPDSGAVGCRPDGEGSWAVGMFYGSSPLALRPIELEGRSNGNSSAWPVANPVLTCGTATEAGYPSNFVADPFLYVEVRQRHCCCLFCRSSPGWNSASRRCRDGLQIA